MPSYETVHVRFAEVKRTERRTFNCAGCKRRQTRQRTFTQTINPFNKNKTTGIQKTRAEIAQELREEGAKWDPKLCRRCQESDRLAMS